MVIALCAHRRAEYYVLMLWFYNANSKPDSLRPGGLRSLFSAKLAIRIIFGPDGSPRPSGTEPILESSVTGAEAEAPAYYQGVPPDFAKTSSSRIVHPDRQ